MSSITAQLVSGWRIRLTVNVDGIPSTSTISVNRYGGETNVPHPIVGATRIKPAPIVLDDPETPLVGLHSWALESTSSTGAKRVEDVAILEITTADRPVLSDPVRQLAVAVVLCAEGQDHTMAGRASSVDVAGRAARVWSWSRSHASIGSVSSGTRPLSGRSTRRYEPSVTMLMAPTT